VIYVLLEWVSGISLVLLTLSITYGIHREARKAEKERNRRERQH